MQAAAPHSQSRSIAASIAHEHRQPTVRAGVWLQEHDWLYRIFKSPENHSPRFRLPDLLSACVSLTVDGQKPQRELVEYLHRHLTLRDPKTECRSCDIWSAQFEQLMAAHRAAWNRFPNPMFELDHITTGCVAVVMTQPEGAARVLAQARRNFLARVDARRAVAD